MQVLMNMLAALRTRDEGATMVEYGLMVALIAVVALVGAELLGLNVLGIFNNTANELAPGAP